MVTTRPDISGTFGMIASTHWLASAAGMAVLEAGGNAVDAAVAAGFTLQVVEPHLNGPGGDMVLMMTTADGSPVVVNGQGPAPAGADADTYRGLGLDLVPGSGLLAAAVPGSTVAWLTLLAEHGTARVHDVLRFAIHYAETGYPVLPSIARSIGGVADLFTHEWTTSAETYLPGGQPPAAGTQLRNPALAATYRYLVDEAAAAGPDREAGIAAALAAWQQGRAAQEIDAFARTSWLDSSGERHAGVITAADVAGFRCTTEPAVQIPFGDWTVAKSAAWGQGPVFGQQLRLLDGQLPRTDGPDVSADFVHLVTESAKLAFADRDAWYGDTDDVPLATLLSAEYATQRRGLIGDAASLELRPGRPDGREPRLPRHERFTPDGDFPAGPGGRPAGLAAGTGGEPTVGRIGQVRGDTCHVTVTDRWGTMVAATPSGGWLQSSPIIPALGFPLGSRLQMTTLEPGLPTTLTPGRRPRTTLSPSLAFRDGRPELAFGTPGGDQQDQWQVTFFLRIARQRARHVDLPAVIDAPMFHTTHFPSSFHPREAYPGELVAEERFGAAVLDDLRGRGHRLVVGEPWSLGRLCVTARDPATGVLRAAADPRGRQGYAIGR
ncbi:gamma-glutamyltransferase [Nakamurella flavida]|uniref:Gamma-glutamyltransferase n=1 Tax=Nakamurella flavida TaxID=363630 RepID=A0A938YGE0_9ACTN|nr:gamma-glutamyltransferase [Nakamurella flavida]MBM9477200.1 gamma-glutamyltransferase [Nakamurella flavida]MDP9780149.1 gamma-glutamyltranspeptidase/glutathione hydrolase [Nakamurella flavida]